MTTMMIVMMLMTMNVMMLMTMIVMMLMTMNVVMMMTMIVMMMMTMDVVQRPAPRTEAAIVAGAGIEMHDAVRHNNEHGARRGVHLVQHKLRVPQQRGERVGLGLLGVASVAAVRDT
jgi:hypothetical protein